MPRIELTKKFRFESAHRLAKGYKGDCANIHGHSWNGELTISVDSDKLDEYDFGLDYGDMKPFLKSIEDLFDHALLVYGGDVGLIQICKENDWKIHVFRHNPTSEIIAQFIFDNAQTHFDNNGHTLNGIVVESVTIEETCTSRCVYKK